MRPPARCLILATICLGAVSCTNAPPPNVVLILVDTLRADRLGPYGNRRGLTPFLDELAGRGVVFLNAYSTTSHTVPAVASLFTSRYVSQHRMFRADSVLDRNEVMLAQHMERSGYTTAAFIGNFLINKERGYDRGFEKFFHLNVIKVHAATLRDQVREWLDQRPADVAARPLFLYLHYFDPHAPYEPSAAYRKRFQVSTAAPVDEEAAKEKTGRRRWKDLSRDEVALLASLYDAEVAGFDAQLRREFDDLRERHILDNAVVIITADHGEEFQEHGQVGHGVSLFNELIHIPLIILGPNCPAAIVRDDVSLVDVAPTLLELTGQPIPSSFEGRSLVRGLCQPRLRDRWRSVGSSRGNDSARPVLVELETNAPPDLLRHTAGIVAGSTKLLLTPQGQEQLYDLSGDPMEAAPATAPDPRAAQLRTMLESTRALLQARAAASAERRPLDEDTKQKMRALGYDPD